MSDALTLKDCTVKLLDISTAHIDKGVADWINDDLDSSEGILVGTRWSCYGWILWTHSDWVYDKQAVVPASLRACMQFALEHGFDYLKLDCDAGELPQHLPTYDW